MGDKANVGQIFPFQEIGYVRDVSIEVDVLAQEMRSVCQPGQ
jgi:hypothetical protein